MSSARVDRSSWASFREGRGSAKNDVNFVSLPPSASEIPAARFERDVPGQNVQLRPRNLADVTLLDRPAEPARLGQAHVIRHLLSGANCCCPRAAPDRSRSAKCRRYAMHSR
jgi:hypothetical protein